MNQNEINSVLADNLTQILNVCSVVLPSMIKRHSGAIINISSVQGVTGAACEAVYSAAKGALNSFTKALSKEAAPNGVRVNAIAAGVIKTRMNDFLNEQEKNALKEQIPLGRFGTANEVAEAVYFLSFAEYITGQILSVDGGWT